MSRPPLLQDSDYPSLGDWPVVRKAPTEGCFLRFYDNRLELRDGSRPESRGVYATFDGPAIRRRLESGMKSPLAKALGLPRRPKQTVLDATCGLGRDSAVLLGLGCQLLAAERNPVLQQLLLDAIRRLNPLPDNWLGLECRDASEIMLPARSRIDAVYIDPMFHAPSRKALPKLEMQLLRQVVGDDLDANTLLNNALKIAQRRVVVKSHPRSQPLAPPDLQQLSGKTRFDIYLTGEKSVK